MQGLDDLGLLGLGSQQAPVDQHVENLLTILVGQLALQLDRAGQQSELMAQVDVLGGQEASGRRQVVGGHGGETQLAIGLSGQRRALRVVLEPEDRGAQNASVAQIVTHPRLNDSEVLADHQRTRPMGLEHEDADQRLMVVTDVRALTGKLTVRNPPQPEEPDDVVDPDSTGMTQGGA